MALDFHRLDNNEYLFELDDSQYANVEIIFIEFKKQTGIYIDPYRDAKLSVTHQKTIIQIIDAYINKQNLNINKQQAMDIIGFNALIKYFSKKGIELKVLGD